MLKPTVLLDTIRILSESVAPDLKIAKLNDGRLLWRLLNENPVDHATDPDANWTHIQQRIATVFGEGIIDWDAVKKVKSLPRSSPADEAVVSNSELMSVTLMVLYVSAVHDQRKNIMDVLSGHKITALRQSRIENAFKILMDNKKFLTQKILLKILADFSKDNPDMNSGTPSTSFTYSPTSSSTPKTPLSNFFR